MIYVIICMITLTVVEFTSRGHFDRARPSSDLESRLSFSGAQWNDLSRIPIQLTFSAFLLGITTVYFFLLIGV